MSNKIYITDAQAAGYAQEAGIRRNVLCALPKSEKAEQPPILNEQQKAALSAALRPKCITKAEVLLNNDGLLMLLSAGRDGKTALIGREGDKNILVPIGKDDLTSTVLAYLLEDGEPKSSEAGIKINGDAFLLLLALADTYRRRYLAGLVNHEAQETPITLEDLKKTVEDAYNESDTRWLFPFVLMTQNYPAIDMQSALEGLYEGGILKANSLELTSDGERFADELMYLDSAVHIGTIRVQDDSLMREDILLLRSRESLWCAVIGKEESELFTLSAEKMFELVDEICEELDEPRDDAEEQQTETKKSAEEQSAGNWQCTCGIINSGKFCAGCGKPKPEKPIQNIGGSWQCACGSLNKGDFCPKCGAKRSSVPIAPSDGSWKCSCGRTNKGDFCPNCGAKRR